MTSGFYNRNSLRYLPIGVPQFYVELDHFLGSLGYSFAELTTHPQLPIPENLCRRYADIQFYRHNIESFLKHPDPFFAETISSTYIVGYFAASKSIYDAVSVGLSNFLNLPLKNKEQDFSKGKFWLELKTKNSSLEQKYRPFLPHFQKVVKWRDAAIHRVAPTLTIHSKTPPEKTPRDQIEIKLLDDPDFNLAHAGPQVTLHWVKVEDLLCDWGKIFDDLSIAFCNDVKSYFVRK